MNPKEVLLLLGVLVALFCVPAAVAADDGGFYITVTADTAKKYDGIAIKTVKAFDPLDTKKAWVTLDTAGGKSIMSPQIESISRNFSSEKESYKGVTIDVKKVSDRTTWDDSPLEYQHPAYIGPVFPGFTVKVPGKEGNVLLIRYPDNVDGGASFTEIFNSAEKEVYLFAEKGALYYTKSSKQAHSYPGGTIEYDEGDLNYTLVQNEVKLDSFIFDKGDLGNIKKPRTGEYLLAAVKYNKGDETLSVYAATPILILDKDTAVTATDTYYKNSGGDMDVQFGDADKIAYALIKKGETYDLLVDVDTKKLAGEFKATSMTDLVSMLKSTTESDNSVTYALTLAGEKVKEGSTGLVIAEGYGCAGYAEDKSVNIEADTLKALKAGTYSLYALGMTGQKVTAIDQKEIAIAESRPTPPSSGGGGGGGGVTTPSGPDIPVSHERSASVTTDSSGVVTQAIEVSAVDAVASLLVPTGVVALDKEGNPLSEIFIDPLASAEMPAIPAGATFSFAGYVYEAGPAGATFDPPITLTFNIPEDIWDSLDIEGNDLVVKWYNEETGEWESVPTTLDMSTRSVNAEVSHFTIFALFTEPATVTTPTDTTTPTTPPAEGDLPAGEFPMTTVLAIFTVLVIVIAAGYFFMVRK
ncbi:MAG: hypothetical protein GX216_07975 [Methanomicrobiales archaeon]|nr:hypothetical protein [Methanomicrobiales archaeon]